LDQPRRDPGREYSLILRLDGQWAAGLLNLFGSSILGLIAVALGIILE